MFNEAAAPVGGEMNHYVLDVAARLRAAGEVVALVHGRQPKAEFRGARYLFDHLRKMGASAEEVRVRLEAIVDDFKPDVIQIHGVPNLALDPWLAACAPTLRWVHNHLPYCSGGAMTLAWPRRPCRRAHGPGCLALHALRGCGSPDPLHNLVRYRQVSAALSVLRALPRLQVASGMMKANLVRNGIDPARIEQIPLYAPPPAPASEPRRAPPTARRFILQPGSLVPHKGAWLLVREIAKLPRDVDLVFAGGGGKLERPLKKYAARHGLSDRVRVMGEVNPDQWRLLFSQAALVAMPSLWNEPLGLAGLYAMAHGKPVVAFRGSGIDEWLEDGQTGLAIAHGAHGAPNAFVTAVASLLQDTPLAQKLGRGAAERWSARFQPEHHLENLRACYARMAATPSTTPPDNAT